MEIQKSDIHPEEQIELLYKDVDDRYILNYALKHLGAKLDIIDEHDAAILLRMIKEPDPGSEEHQVSEKLRKVYYGQLLKT